MKILFDFLPILLFFVAFKYQGIYVATGVAIAVSTIQVTGYWLKYRRVETMHIVTLVLIGVLGGATLGLHNELFIKWKPTAVNWAFAVIFWASRYIGSKSLIERMLADNIELPAPVWQRLNTSWVIFFLTMGLLNLYVIYHFDTNTWVNFKLFGLMGLTIVFVIIQAIYMSKYINTEQQKKELLNDQ